MGRRRVGAKTFPFRIAIVPGGQFRPVRLPVINTSAWKAKAHHSIRMRFWYQAKKAQIRARFKWYKFYSVNGYGSPGRLEFICPESGMVAKTVNQLEAASFRKYWIDCYKKSIEIVRWLDSIDISDYNFDLHSYLIKLLIVKNPILREVRVYNSRYPFKPARQWQETFIQGSTMKS